ncbi:unnamed protein product [Paramecium sonneborni]|uniref:Kelch motif family protein n=1 Tax=Paramecium sonneborni TaxID=65129 RepID=A0A8S1L4A8_9CILI|nr:unnamed protein product [Paramecium sonneborni]
MKAKKQQDDAVLEEDLIKNKSQLDYFPKWQELKPLGKNIHRRSYHSCVAWDNYIYVYGGYETNEGVLDDLMKIPFPNLEKPLTWTQVYKKNLKEVKGPGPLRNHTAVTYQNKMYIFGGKENLIQPCCKLWIFDFQSEEWNEGQECKINNNNICVEGHNSCVFVQGDIASMIVFGGFYTDKGYVSQVLQYSINENVWTIYQEQQKTSPLGRAGAGAAILGNDLYVFGGCNYEQRFSDFWKFDLINKKWEQIKTEKSPGSRSSSVIVQHNQGLYLFGGIHDITHEKNDLWMFKNNEWVLLEEDNSRRQVNDDLNDSLDKASQSKPNKQKEKAKNQDMQNRTIFLLGEDSELRSPQRRGSLKNITLPAGNQKIITEQNNVSQATNNMEELKKRRWQQKKMQMLAEFELTEEEKQKFRSSSPTTEQIKNSINLITNQDKGGQRKISSPVGRKQQQTQAQLIGKKPCARDGHSVIVAGEFMIVFGGDRNLMSFNDLYMYTFSNTNKQTK